MKISNEYTREKAKELEVKMRHILTEVAQASSENQYYLDMMLEAIDYEELYLGVSLRMQTIHGCVVHGQDPIKVDYRSNPLFSQYGCLLMEIPEWDIKITQNDAIVVTKEIWVLQDLSLVGIRSCGVYFDSSAIGCEYREECNDDFWESIKKLKLRDLVGNLQNLAHYRKYLTSAYHIVTEDI